MSHALMRVGVVWNLETAFSMHEFIDTQNKVFVSPHKMSDEGSSMRHFLTLQI